jgi:hypothetical protein
VALSSDVPRADKDGHTFTVNSSVDELFSCRLSNSLKAEKIYSVRDLIRYSEGELLELCNIGRLSVKEIKEALKFHGMTLRGSGAPLPEMPPCDSDWECSIPNVTYENLTLLISEGGVTICLTLMLSDVSELVSKLQCAIATGLRQK